MNSILKHSTVKLMPFASIDITQNMIHHFNMRTTLTIDDDILKLAARRARLRGVSLSRTVSDLLRRGLTAPTPSKDKDGIVVFQLPADSPRVTTDEVRRIETEGA
jgi:Arc/MetJ family transcription regulator